jgi:hypothetical protein
MTRTIRLVLDALTIITPALAEGGQNALPPVAEQPLDPEAMEALYEARVAYAGANAGAQICRAGGLPGGQTPYLNGTFNNYVAYTGIDMDDVRATVQELIELAREEKNRAIAFCHGNTWSVGRIESGKFNGINPRAGNLPLTAEDMDVLARKWVDYRDCVLAGERVRDIDTVMGR